jgi:hemerythrin-like domain-containing protein
VTTDAIVMLREDHKEIRRAFREFEKVKDGTSRQKQQHVDRIISLLTEHTHIENEVMYPRVRELLPALEDNILESYEEHHVADRIIEELSLLHPQHERFTAKTMVLIENVRHHMEEEESDWFPRVRDGLGRKVLQDLGAELKQARKNAPGPPEPGLLQKAINAVFS